MHVLWLASWYPDVYEPMNGDFIQRNARAVAEHLPLTVIHLAQAGKETNTKKDWIKRKENQLEEWVCSFSYKKTGIIFIDKIRYHLKYRMLYRKVLLQYLKQYGKPDLVHVHVPMKAGMIARRFARDWQVPYIVSEHASMYDTDAKESFDKRSRFFRQNTAKVFREAAIVTNVSAAIAIKLKQLFQVKQLEVIHNLADTGLFRYQSSTAPSTFTWIHVSSLLPQKNAEGMIEAFDQLYQLRQDWQLVVVGPASGSFKKMVENKGLSGSIFFTGELSYAEVAQQMQQSSALVLFSRQENFPCVIVEALCCGLPVVSSTAGGVAEAINETNGLLVDPGRVLQLTNTLHQLMNQYQQYNRELIAIEAVKKYSHTVIAGQIIQLYQKLLY